MMPRALIGAVLMGLLFAPAFEPAHADVVFDNFDSGGTFSPTNNFVAASAFKISSQATATRAAAQFTVTGGDFKLSSITLPIAQQSSLTGNFLRVRLTDDAGGVPGTTLE